MTVSRRRLLAPEVIQTSSIDCGPACLRSAFAGYGLELGYDALRDACQTDVDGTSLDALERVANQLGLVAEQIWVPVDHLTIAEVSPLPAILVTQVAGGAAHFIVAWRQVGALFQIMDPIAGRRWVTRDQLASMVYPYELEIDAAIWRDWASTPEFARTMDRRLRALRADATILAEAQQDPEAISLASLDAAARMVSELVRAGAVRRGGESGMLVRSLAVQAAAELKTGASARSIAETFFSALPVPETEPKVRLRGAILLRLRGCQTRVAQDAAAASVEPAAPGLAQGTVTRVRSERPRRPWLEAIRLLRREGGLTGSLVAASAVGAAVLALLETLLLRGLLDVGQRLQGTGQKLVAAGLFLALLALGTIFDVWNSNAVRAVGRRFELRLRISLLAKIPRLADVYFRSRPASDMAHRSHSIHPVRNIPLIAGRLVRLAATVLATVGGLVWLDPAGTGLTLAAAGLCLFIPFMGQALLQERDLKVRVHDARLAQFNLDAFLGLLPIRAHGAERAVRGEHGAIVFEWVKACKERLRVSVTVELVQSVAAAVIAILVIGRYVQRSTEPGAILLLGYWVLSLPLIGEEMATLTRQLPRYQNLLGRVLEPIHAPTLPSAAGPSSAVRHDEPYRSPTDTALLPIVRGDVGTSDVRAVGLHFDDVALHVGGREVVEAIKLRIRPGEHVAIVGASGAGKSTLLSLLLGWNEATSGRIFVDGEPLDVDALRTRTAWVDPGIALWSTSVLDNLRYGTESGDPPIAKMIDQAALVEVLGRLPNGLQSELGEGGRLISGGEGQRVRLGRALARDKAGLVLLDEPFRGLERSVRDHLLRTARGVWKDATLLCVTHDISHALDFDRVLVIDGGRIVEDGAPRALVKEGRFQRLLRADAEVHRKRWSDPSWRRLRVEAGRLCERVPEQVGS